ncbi:GNAT family N-acetyltransferase [Pelomonas sp. KK5]|uniref:GNAT family N-acetyltransferase n=1 Tax=Pelomonas sp. KK5 TaxID=1855730 RepID=UPI0009FAFC62|nr:GNAT family N-acetyltransferase [Pelomonas sp. KK5]
MAELAASSTAPADCRIRLLREPELVAYKALRDGMLAGHPDAFTSDAETELKRDADSYRPRLGGNPHGGPLFTLAAWSGPQLVGAISAEREPRQKVRHIAHIVGMMVADEMQGCGIGALLLQSALRLLQQDATLDQATLSVTASNFGAVRLYERHGFMRYGLLAGALKLPDGRLLDKALMVRPLR